MDEQIITHEVPYRLGGAVSEPDVRFTPEADIAERDWNVRFVPQADIGAFIRSRRRHVRHCRLGLSILRLKVSALGERQRCRHVIAHKLVKLLHRK